MIFSMKWPFSWKSTKLDVGSYFVLDLRKKRLRIMLVASKNLELNIANFAQIRNHFFHNIFLRDLLWIVNYYK